MSAAAAAAAAASVAIIDTLLDHLQDRSGRKTTQINKHQQTNNTTTMTLHYEQQIQKPQQQ
jgi:ribosomal protein S12 methylthiotransferase accessory factor YcaO